MYCEINHLTSEYISIRYNKDGKLATMKKPLSEIISWYSADEVQVKSIVATTSNKPSVKKNSNGKSQEREPRGNVSVQLHSGFGLRIAEIPKGIHGDTEKHYNQLLRGFCFGGILTYTGNKGHGIGLHYNNMLIFANSLDFQYNTPDYTLYGKVKERINLHYSGISYEFLKKPEFRNYWRHLSVGLGWSAFREEFIAGEILKIKGDALALQIGYSMLYPINSQLRIGIHGLMSFAWTSNFRVFNGLNYTTIKSDKPESMIRSQLGVSFVYSMSKGG